jgi:hypothetical protein
MVLNVDVLHTAMGVPRMVLRQFGRSIAVTV